VVLFRTAAFSKSRCIAVGKLLILRARITRFVGFDKQMFSATEPLVVSQSHNNKIMKAIDR
jgi:hypothetical protein